MKKLLALLLFIVATFSFVSCKNGEDTSWENSGEQTTETVRDVIENGYYYIGDFETKRQCVEIGITRSMKKAMNDNTAYITHGDYSLRFELWPHAYDNFGGEITFNPSYSTYFRRKNFSDCEYFCFDLYVEKGVDFCTIRPRASGADYNYKVENLVQGWNYIEFPMSKFVYEESKLTETQIKMGLVGKSYAESIEKININFPKQDYVQVYYIDNVRYKLKAE